MDTFYEEVSLAKKDISSIWKMFKLLLIYSIQYVQTINNGQSGHFDGKNHSLSKLYK